MSGPTSLPTLLNVRRTDIDLEVTVRAASGEVERWVFGTSNDTTNQYVVTGIGHSLDDSTKGCEVVTLSLWDKQGKTFPLTVTTDDFDRFLPEFYPPERLNVFTAVRYADDHMTFDFISKDGEPCAFSIGTVGDHHPYTMTEYGFRWRDVDGVYSLRFYTLIDRAGTKWIFEMVVPKDQFDGFLKGEHAYFQALKERLNPKHEAADFLNVLQQAA